VKPSDRRKWIIKRIAQEPGGVVDVCNNDFVRDYIDATGASYRETMWGAPKCPQLGRDLSRMALRFPKPLKRARTGLWNMAGLGFPRWVWSYRVRPVDIWDPSPALQSERNSHGS
jgi:hypothetical protein